jgi:hypothetical protein
VAGYKRQIVALAVYSLHAYLAIHLADYTGAPCISSTARWPICYPTSITADLHGLRHHDGKALA